MVTMPSPPKFTDLRDYALLVEGGAFIKGAFFECGAKLRLDPREAKYLVNNGVIGAPGGEGGGDKTLAAETRQTGKALEDWLKELNAAFVSSSTMNAKQARDYVAKNPDKWRDAHLHGGSAAEAAKAEIATWKPASDK